jgi:hypothetical protein
LDDIRQYLLGTLAGEARQRVEERLLLEEDFLEELLSGEDELIDQYLHATLSEEERDGFERHFLSTPERHQKLRFGRAFGQYISKHSKDARGENVEGENVEMRPAAAAAAAVGGATTTEPTWAERFRAFWSGQTWGSSASLALALVAIISGALWVFSQRTPSPRTFAALALNVSAGNRAEGVQPVAVRLPLNADALRISLTLPGGAAPATHYRAESVDVDGRIKPLQIDGQDAQSVSVVIPAAQLARGQYALRLFKTEADGAEQRVPGSYFFNVE